MARYKLTNKAIDDLTEIWDYTVEEWSTNQAEKYYNLIIASCADLAQNPKFGKPYDTLSLDVFGYKCGQHIIFYRILTPNEIEIARVLHSRMDLKTRI